MAKLSLHEWVDFAEIYDTVTYTWTLSYNSKKTIILSDDNKKYKFGFTYDNEVINIESLNESRLHIKYITLLHNPKGHYSTKNQTGFHISKGETILLKLNNNDLKHSAISSYAFAYHTTLISCTFIIVKQNFTSIAPLDEQCPVAPLTTDPTAAKLELVRTSALPDLDAIFENMKFSDVILNVQGKEFNAHKVFLTTASPVFSAMFENKMEESKTNEVFIQDVSHDVFKEMLRFIYTGKIGNLKEMALELWVAADKYALQELKKICENVLIGNISVQSACEILIIADQHSATDLKATVVDFITENATYVCKSSCWDDLAEQHPRLMCQLYRHLASKARHMHY